MNFRKLFIFISVLLIITFGYQIYLRFPQSYDIGSCVKDSQLNEIYKVVTKAKRQTSFKDNWFFGPMVVDIKLITPNPNALHKEGEIRTVDQDDHFLSLFTCQEIQPASGQQRIEILKPTVVNTQNNQEELNKKMTAESNSDRSDSLDNLVLNGGNFESFVLKCFAGVSCKFGEDPKKMYQDFKENENRTANDSLISFMRSQLKNKEFRDKYKDLLKQLINDFYPQEEKQFQVAAYYNYLGDLQKSLDIYLDLQKRSQSDPSLKSAPLLNIANTLYDMHRFKESLPYYEAALQDSLARQEKLTPNSENFNRRKNIGNKKTIAFSGYLNVID